MPLRLYLSAVLLSGIAIDVSAVADDRADTINVLIVTGGHGFERKPFFELFQSIPAITFEEAKQGKTAVAYERSNLHQFDVVILFDMLQEITAAQKAAFMDLTEHGTGLMVMHHALVSYQDWPDYERIAGGRYPEDQEHRGEVTEKLGYRHDVDIPVKIVAKDHPVTEGIDDFAIRDEIYWGFRVSEDVTPLLVTTHPDSGNPIAWAHEVGKSRVVTIQLGDSPSAYANPSFSRLIGQSIKWVANR